MAVEVANPLTHEYLTGQEQELLRFRLATETSYNLDVSRMMIAASLRSKNGEHIDQLMEDTLGFIQFAPEEGITRAPAPLIDVALKTIILDTSLHRDICERMGKPLVHRRVPEISDSWVHPQEITPVTTRELLTIGEAELVTEEIASALAVDFRYIAAVDHLRLARKDKPIAELGADELSVSILEEALLFLHARSRGLVEQAPGILVDAGWHTLITADTVLYDALCNRIGNKFLHHVPNPLLGEGPTPTSNAIVTSTVEELKANGYEPNDDLWFGLVGCNCYPDWPGDHPSC